MYFHFTIIKVMPENVEKAASILGSVPTRDFFASIKGINTGLLLESLEEPGKLYSFSIWDSMADAQAVFADPNYAMLIGDLRSLLISAPERYGHNLLNSEIFQDVTPTEKTYIHNTIVTVLPENVQNLLSILYSEKMLDFSRTIPGFLRAYALESLDEPGRIVSMSWWDSPTDAQKTFTMPEYAALLGDMRALMIQPPERHGFRVLLVVIYHQKVMM